MQRLLVLNLFISLLWPILNGEFSLRSLLLGFALGFVLLAIVQRKYGYYTLMLFKFTIYVLYAILQSNLRLTAIVLGSLLRPTSRLRPGIVAVPLTLTNPLDITVLASIITLTPGTLSVDLAEDVGGELWPYSGSEDQPVQGRKESGPLQNPHEEQGRPSEAAALLIHGIDIAEPQAFRTEIKHNFERPILELRRILEDLDVADT